MRLGSEGRVVLVTGAAQGIGRAVGKVFAAGGAIVHLADVDRSGVERSAADLGVAGHHCDLSDRASATRLVQTIIEREDRLDVLALAAGGVGGQVGQPVDQVTTEAWHALFRANVDTALFPVQAAVPHLKARGWGRVVTVSSGAGLRPSLTGIQAYAAAKHALVGLTRQLSLELAPHGIMVNSVAPGLVLSNPTTERQWAGYAPAEQARILESLHTRRLGTAEDVAAAVLFLASEAAGWITGQVLSVDGGRL